MSDEEVNQTFSAAQATRRVLFVSAWTTGESVVLRQELLDGGYQVETTGVGEALWLWPLPGYDLVLIDATERPETGVELCRHIKYSSPAQRVALLLGDRTGTVPHHLEADAVWSGAPTPTQLLGAVHLLLAPSLVWAPGDVLKKPAQRSVLEEHAKKTSA